MNHLTIFLRHSISNPRYILISISLLIFFDYSFSYKNNSKNNLILKKITIFNVSKPIKNRHSFNETKKLVIQHNLDEFSNQRIHGLNNSSENSNTTNNFTFDLLSHKNKHPYLYSKVLKSPLYSKNFPNISADIQKQNAIKEAFLHAWNGYKKYCWGHDIFHPISQTHTDYLKGGLTIIDSLSTLLIMGLDEEVELSKNFIAKNFNPRGEWSLFEFIIRYIGGFISAYYLSNDDFYKEYAILLGEAVYPIIEKKKGFFSSRFYIQKVKNVFKASTNYSTKIFGLFHEKFKDLNDDNYCLAEVGSFQMEFLALTDLTGDKKFANLALSVYRNIWNNEKSRGLLSNTIGSGYDTYYEYLIKTYLQTRGSSSEILKHYMLFTHDAKEKLVFKFKKFVCIGIKTRYFLRPSVEHFTTFAAGMLTLGTVKDNKYSKEEMILAEQLTRSYYWSYCQFKSGLMPDYVLFNFNKKKQENKNNLNETHKNSNKSEVHDNSEKSEIYKNSNKSEVHDNDDLSNGEIVPEGEAKFVILTNKYNLRPETIESIYWLWKFTGDKKYREMAWRIFKSINRTCRVKHGFTAVTNLEKKNPDYKDEMDSYFLSETLKYFYLIFSDSTLISPVDWVLNTEAHPFKILQESTIKKIQEILEFKDENDDYKRNYNNNKNSNIKPIKRHRIISGHFN